MPNGLTCGTLAVHSTGKQLNTYNINFKALFIYYSFLQEFCI
jgi:hypothetical protein